MTTVFTPKTRDELRAAVVEYINNKQAGIEKYGIINNWDVSNVTDMSELFYCCSCCYCTLPLHKFNEDISSWDVSNVTNMENMFNGCKEFNQPLDSWDVSNVTDMGGMFSYCSQFNQPLGLWNVSNVTNMKCMFYWCTKFNQPLDSWNVSNIASMNWMFYNTPMKGYKFNVVSKLNTCSTVEIKSTNHMCIICYDVYNSYYKLCTTNSDHFICKECCDILEESKQLKCPMRCKANKIYKVIIP